MVTVEFDCTEEELQARAARIVKLAGEARTFMQQGIDSGCIAKYYCLDVELGRLSNMLAKKEKEDFKQMVSQATDDPPGK